MQSISKPLPRSSAVLFGLALAVTGGVAGISSAYAQSAECGCLVAAGTAGVVQSASGNVFVSQPDGSIPAQANMRLHVGNSVLVGPKSASTVSFGRNCTLHLRANTVFEVHPHDGKLCLAVNNQAQSTTGGTAAASGGAGYLAAGLIGGGLGIGLVDIATSDHDKPVSK